jgi:hypothetical protein
MAGDFQKRCVSVAYIELFATPEGRRFFDLVRHYWDSATVGRPYTLWTIYVDLRELWSGGSCNGDEPDMAQVIAALHQLWLCGELFERQEKVGICKREITTYYTTRVISTGF